ncbi:MAG: heparinase II/III family protein [Bacteroidota bacterium]
MKQLVKTSFFFFLLLASICQSTAQSHPNLILTKEGVTIIRQSKAEAPLFAEVLEATKQEVEAEMEAGIFVPIPKDMAGGYTHERHKRNFFILQKAGNLYQITHKDKYAIYIRDMFLEYAKLYPTLGLHPSEKSYARGKIFWQCLNDANWLVYCSQAYDCIYDFLTIAQRRELETNLFRPLADFLSEGNPKFFNRIHNHSAWGNAAVGMIGLVMKDEELVERALYGLTNDDLDNSMLDNDGGFIKIDGQNQAGFLAQLDLSFSPDGYFTEGPYYLRYAMTPFLLFSKALSNNRPDLNIYEYRNGILEKAVDALLNQTDVQGQFFPINDAQKGMSWKAREVIAAVDIAYADFGQDPMLLSIAEMQAKVLLDETGFKVARDLQKGMAKEYVKPSVAYRDGANGEKGGIAILRKANKEQGEICVVLKYSAHGMGHGHFDKLSYSLYDETGEIIQDYGAVRWVNIDQKGGGRYLLENNTFAKQSIGHNTLVINETSQYEGSVKKGEAHHPDLYFFDAENEAYQVISAKDQYAYPGTTLHRTLLLLEDDHFRNPLLVDVFRVTSPEENQLDLPLWFMGHLLSANFDYSSQTTQLAPLGEHHGYQHLWKEASGKSSEQSTQLTWFSKGKFFTMSCASALNEELILARGGANDPNFNLRHDPVFIQRRRAKNSTFVSVIESHGTYNPVSEIPDSPFSGVAAVEVLHDDDVYTAVQLTHKTGVSWTLLLANQEAAKDAIHKLNINGQTVQWEGPFNWTINQ